MSNKYSAISKYYDRLMSDYPYESVLEFLKKRLKGRGVELGTGTGRLAVALTKAGLTTVGVDESAEMLSVATENARKACVKAVFINADVREYEFFDCDFVLAPCDVFNYLVEDGEMQDVIDSAYDALSSGGTLFFDLSTAEKLRSEAGTFMEDHEDVTLVWDNTFDGDIAELTLTVFERSSDGTYKRSDESHVQRAYSQADVVEMLAEAGFEVTVMDQDLNPIENFDEKGVTRAFFLATAKK